MSKVVSSWKYSTEVLPCHSGQRITRPDPGNHNGVCINDWSEKQYIRGNMMRIRQKNGTTGVFPRYLAF